MTISKMYGTAVKLFLWLCYIFASCTLAYAESDNKKIVKNGLDVLPLKTSQVISLFSANNKMSAESCAW